MNDDLDLIAAAEHMLSLGWNVFSKKQSQDTGEWWIIIQPVSPTAMKNALAMDGRTPASVKSYGSTLGEAVDNAFTTFGIGGLAWRLRKLEVRCRALREHLGFKDTPLPKKTCPHGTTGAKCRKCV